MKGLGKKLIFGIACIVVIDSVIIFLLTSPNPLSMWPPELFLFGFKGGIILWLFLNVREARRKKVQDMGRKK